MGVHSPVQMGQEQKQGMGMRQMGKTRRDGNPQDTAEGGRIGLGMGPTLANTRDRREKERPDGHDITLVDAIRHYLTLFDAI